MVAILTGMRWNHSVVLICISFMPRDEEHFFMFFLTSWISFFERNQLPISFLGPGFCGSTVFKLPTYSGYHSFV
jgi:hypothetical protein